MLTEHDQSVARPIYKSLPSPRDSSAYSASREPVNGACRHESHDSEIFTGTDDLADSKVSYAVPQTRQDRLCSRSKLQLVETHGQSPNAGSIFERSVDSTNALSQTTAPVTNSKVSLVDSLPNIPTSGPALYHPHAQSLIDNQIPTVLDASVDAIINSEDLNKIEVVTAKTQIILAEEQSQRYAITQSRYQENICTANLPLSPCGTQKRLSFVSYVDLVGIEHAEADTRISDELRPNHSSNSSRMRTDAPYTNENLASQITQKGPVFLSPQKDFEIQRDTMLNMIQQPAQLLQKDQSDFGQIN